MNSQIHDKKLTASDGNTKNHQAYAQELSRLRGPKEICDNTDNMGSGCSGIQQRFGELEKMVGHERNVNYNKKKIAMDTGADNQFQKAQKGTEVGLAKVTKSADKTSSSIMDKILDNKSQANKSKEVQDKILTKSSPLSEEISKMKYLIEYMNNNKKQIL
jgi:hypothetical protein